LQLSNGTIVERLRYVGEAPCLECGVHDGQVRTINVRAKSARGAKGALLSAAACKSDAHEEGRQTNPPAHFPRAVRVAQGRANQATNRIARMSL
jgi:hypothetical protein